MLHILYDSNLMLTVLSALVMHSIIHIHMQSALQSLGITDHPHEANVVSPCYLAGEVMALLLVYEYSIISGLGKTMACMSIRGTYRNY